MTGENESSRSRSSSTSGRSCQLRAVSIAVVALLIGSCVATSGLVGVTSAETLVDLDEDTPLTERSTWEKFESKGVATADVAAPDLEITVSKTHDELDVDGFHNDYANEFIRVKYSEDIDRTIRFYVPSNYFGAYYDEHVESVAGDDAVAKLVPVQGGRYTAVTITFTGKTNAVFSVSQLKGETWSFWGEQDEKLENATGVTTGIEGSDQWNYAEASEWSDDGTLRVSNVSSPDSVAIQYDADVSSDQEVWLAVPQGETSSTPVYYFVREGGPDENATIVVVSKNEDPPALRLKKDSSARDGVVSVINDWRRIPDRFGDFVDRVFGSGRK